MIFSKIKNFILKNKKAVIFTTFFLFLFSFDNTFAAD
jgi:predicted RND superfamily exporter protein